MEKLLSRLLYRSHITHVDSRDLHLQLLSHNEFPSIKAVTDTLDYFGIDNVAANVPTDALPQLPDCFLALIGENQLTELVLVIKKNNKVCYTDQTKNKHALSWKDFSEKWTGTIIAIEKEEKKSVSHLRNVSASTIFLALTIVLSGGLLLLSENFVIDSAYILLSAHGLFISYLTTKEELGIKDKVTTKVCGAISGDSHGCSNVINSREGKIFGVISFADASLLFFASTFLFVLLVGANNIIIFGLAALSLPVVLLSIYIQTIKLKQFCLLCLLTSTVLLSQFVLLIFTNTAWEFSFRELAGYLFISSLATFIWLVVKNFWKDSNELVQTLKEYYTFKRNSSFFVGALQSNKSYAVEALQSKYRIAFGKPTAAIKIDAVTNPLCGYCKEPFDAYIKLLETFPEDVQLNLIFNVPTDAENKSNQIVKRILEFYDQDPRKAFNALKDWFSDRDLVKWQARHGISNSMLLLFPEKVIEAHANWCRTNMVFHTPESIINAYPFPAKEYQLTDLQFFIEALKEHFKNSEKTIMV